MAITGISYDAAHDLQSGNSTPHGAGWEPSAQHVWIANNADNAVYKYNASVAYQSKTGLPSGFTQPRGFCWVKSRSEMWGVDTNQNRIYRMNASLVSQGTYNLASGNTTPEGILSFDSIGEVWVVNNSPRRIYRYRASDGAFIAFFALDAAISDPRGGAYQPEADEAWILDQTDKIGRYNGSRQYLGTYALDAVHTYPRSCVSVGSKFWVVDNGIDKVVTYDINTDTLALTAPATLNYTSGSAIATETLPAATGGAGDDTYSVSALPNGLSFNSTTRQLTGTPTAPGTTSVTYTVTDAFGQTATATISIVVAYARSVKIECGYPNRYVVDIGSNDPEETNDFPVVFRWNQKVDFEQADATITGATRVGDLVEKATGVYEQMLRPPDAGSGTITVSVAGNVVTGGNAAESLRITYTDAATATELFDWNTAIPNIQQGPVGNQSYGPEIGFIVEAKRIRMLTRITSPSYQNKIFTLLHDGTRVSTEDIDVASTVNIAPGYLSVVLNKVNDLWFASVHSQINSIQRPDIYRTYWAAVGNESSWQQFYASTFGIRSVDFGLAGQAGQANAAYSADVNRWGLFFPSRANRRVFARNVAGEQQNIDGITVTAPLIALGDRVYVRSSVYRASSDSAAIAVPDENLNLSPTIDGDIAVYGKWFYYVSGTKVYRVDLEKYRVPAVRSQILPQVVKAGDSLSLKHFVDGTETILFDSDYAVPDYLSIDTDLNLSVATDVPQEDTCELVKLRAFNRRYSVPLAFYLVVRKAKRPEWKPIKTLPIDNGETVNLFDLVPNAERIAWKSGFTVPAGYSLTGGVLTVANQTSEAPTPIALTAVNAEGSSDKTFSVQARVPAAIVSSEVYRYRLLIAGIDVSGDLLAIPNIHQSLDVINPNEFVSDDASFTLRSPEGRYDGRVAGNFWDANRLNKNGYLSEIALWVDILDTGAVQSKLLFQGLILEVQSSLNSVNATLNCVDRTYTLKNTPRRSRGDREVFSVTSRARDLSRRVCPRSVGAADFTRHRDRRVR